LAVLEPLDVALGASIRHRRQELGLSQIALGARADVTFQQLQKYETGRNRVSFSTLVRIAQGLECRVADLVGDLDLAEGLTEARVDALEFIARPGAVMLLRGYAGLPQDYQRAVLELVKTLAFKGGAGAPLVLSIFPAVTAEARDRSEPSG
jgi:transcriptional regulator with XRE-family HTH domain